MALVPALTDFTFVEEKKGKLFVNTPNALAGNNVSKCDTSTAKFQSEETGLVDGIGTEDEILGKIRELVTYLPSNCEDTDSYMECTDDLNRVCEDIENCTGDTAIALSKIADNGEFFEVKADFGKNVAVGFIRLNGATVGAVANRSDYYPKDMFVPGLTKTTYIDQVDNGELTFELTISGDTYNALTYRSFRMPLYTKGKYDVTAVPEVLGSLGETSYEEGNIQTDGAAALSDGWSLVLDGSKISVTGSFQTDTAVDDLTPGKMILVSGASQRVYNLTQSAAAGEDGTNVTVKGWTSVDGLEGQDWEIYLELDGVLYNTGYKYSKI